MDVQSLTNGAIGYVQATDQEFRWFEDSLETPSDTVILPAGQTLSDPGRWILIQSGGGDFPPGDEFDQVLTWNTEEEAYLPLGRIATYVISTVEKLEEYFPAQDGVHLIETSSRVEFQGAGFDLGSNRIEVTVTAQLCGWGYTIITSSYAGPTVLVRAADVLIQDLHIQNTAGNTGYCLGVNIPLAAGVQGTCLLSDCRLGQFTADQPWGNPALVTSGQLKCINTAMGDGTIFLQGDEGDAPALWLDGCPFYVNSITGWAVDVVKSSTHVRVDGSQMIGSRAGIIRVRDTGPTPLVELLNCVEGFTGSLSNSALFVDPAAAPNSSFVVSGNTLAGGVTITPSEFSSIQVQDNRFISHQNTRVPFDGFTPSDDGVCCRSNYDFDTFAYLSETALV